MDARSYDQEFDTTAQRLQEVVRSVRSRLGVMEDATHWSGLTREEPAGSDKTQRLAEDLAENASSADSKDGLLHLFLLRQLEISMNLIAELSARVQALESAQGQGDSLRRSA
jgi:hypothetical protein